MKKLFYFMLTVIFAISILSFSGCKDEKKPMTEAKKEMKSDDKKSAEKEPAKMEEKKPMAKGEKKGKLTLVYVAGWDTEVASTNVVRVCLEKLGYEVTLKTVAAPIMYTAVAEKQADGMVAAWLPTLHKTYLEKIKDKVEVLGKNFEGTKAGLVVPKYVTIDSIPEMKDNADKFKGRIVGIGQGAGVMKSTDEAIKEYGLEGKIKLQASSGTAMVAELKKAIDNKEWIAVTGWTPHWKFGKWELKYLKDPKKLYGGEEYIGTIVRKGLKEDHPDAYQVLKNFNWSADSINKVMVMNQVKGSDPYENAKKWVEANPDIVKKWMP